jgi:hypothetical protein
LSSSSKPERFSDVKVIFCIGSLASGSIAQVDFLSTLDEGAWRRIVHMADAAELTGLVHLAIEKGDLDVGDDVAETTTYTMC